MRTQFTCVLTLIALLVPTCVFAAKPRSKQAENATTVEMFEAIEKKQVEVQYIPKDATQANVLIKNKTDKPLKIQLPAAFAGVPVLAQFGGGGMGMGGMGGGMGGGGGGLFNVAPGKVGKIKVQTLCLEHGKPDPNPRMKYKIVKIDSVVEKQEVIELCKLLGQGKLPQNTAQAAAWHMTDDMSWQELATKDRIRLRNGFTRKFFSPIELRYAVEVVREVYSRAEKAKATAVSPGEIAKNDNLEIK